MKAETAYNVIQALPQQEVERLYKMLGVVTATFTTTKNRKRNRYSQMRKLLNIF